MSLVSQMIDTINECLTNSTDEDKSEQESITIRLNWGNGTVVFDHRSQNSLPNCFILTIDNQLEIESQEQYIKEFKIELRKLSLINYQIEVTLLKITEDEEEEVLFYSRGCNTFREKVLFETNLTRMEILEAKVYEYGAEIYLFVLPLTWPEIFDNSIFTANYYNPVATESFAIKIIDADERFENVSFLGRIQDDNHISLTKCIERICSIMKQHLIDSQRRVERDNEKGALCHKPFNNGIVDLTESMIDLELEEQDDDIFYQINTSDDGESRQKRIGYGFAMDLMERDVENDKNDFEDQINFYQQEDLISKKSTSDQLRHREKIVQNNCKEEVEFFSRTLSDIKNFHQNSIKKTTSTSTVGSQLNKVKLSFSSTRPIGPPTNKPHSRLLNSDQVGMWISSAATRTTRSTSNNQKPVNSRSKAFEDLRKLQKRQKDGISGFKIPKYSDKQAAPKSVSSFISNLNENTSIIIDDDDDEDDNNNGNSSGKSIVTIEIDKKENGEKAGSSSFFKNRKQTEPFRYGFFGPQRKHR